MSDTQNVNEGGVTSMSETSNVHVAVLPDGSVAVTSTVVGVPNASAVPGSGFCESVTPQLSTASATRAMSV